MTRMATCDIYDVCPVCGAKRGKRHSRKAHDAWRHKLTEPKTYDQIRADREATYFPVDWIMTVDGD